MSKAIPTQHPAVVLRSQYVQLRTLLAIAMIAVIGLSAAVVILAAADDGGRSAASSVQSAPTQVLPGQRYDGGPEEGTRGPFAVPSPATTRYDGGPEEGTRGATR